MFGELLPRFIFPRRVAHVSPASGVSFPRQKNPFDGIATEEIGECSALWGLDPLLHLLARHPSFPFSVEQGETAQKVLRRSCETLFSPSSSLRRRFSFRVAFRLRPLIHRGFFRGNARAPFRESWRNESKTSTRGGEVLVRARALV